MELTFRPIHRRTWSAKDAAAARELRARLHAVAAEEGAFFAPSRPAMLTVPPGYEAALDCSGEGVIAAIISSPGLSGLTESDFVLAAKMDSLDLAELIVPLRRRTSYY